MSDTGSDTGSDACSHTYVSDTGSDTVGKALEVDMMNDNIVVSARSCWLCVVCCVPPSSILHHPPSSILMSNLQTSKNRSARPKTGPSFFSTKLRRNLRWTLPYKITCTTIMANKHNERTQNPKPFYKRPVLTFSKRVSIK